MFGWDEAQDAYQQNYNGGIDDPNEAKFSHEFVAGAASFAAMKIFEDQQRKEGKTVSHGFAKELLAGIAGGEADKLTETKGMDFVDRERTKHQAKKNAEHLYEEHYERQHNADEYDPERYQPHESYNRY